MANYDANFPADDEYLIDFPAKQRNQQEALKDSAIVNAGKLQGKVSGNSSDNIPINNGTVNTNLNADMLDGKHANELSLVGHIHNDATTSEAGFMSATDKTKLNGIATGAEVNQNAFANVKVGTSTIQADAKSDTLELVAGSNVTLTPDTTNDKVTIASKDTVTTATTSGSGNAVTNITANNGALTVTKGDSFLPLSGGTMSGAIIADIQNIIRRSGNSMRLDIYGGASELNGGTLELFGKDISSDDFKGNVRLLAGNGSSYAEIRLKPNGTTICPTPATTDNSTKIATTAYVKSNLGNYLPLSGGTLTGKTTLVANGTGFTVKTDSTQKGLSFEHNASGNRGLYDYDLAKWVVYVNNNGQVVSVTPTTASNDNQVATTAFVKAQGYITSSGNTWRPLCYTRATTSSTASANAIAVVTENYVSGTTWYRVWSDGWIEQGGMVSLSDGGTYQVTFSKQFQNTNYFAVQSLFAENASQNNGYTNYSGNRTTTGFKIGSRIATQGFWYACGY